MKSIVAFLLAIQLLGSSLLPGFGIDQSSRLIDLVQHFQQHQATNPDLGFLDFMVMHYGADSAHQKHPNHSHHNLPAAGHAAPVFTAPAVVLLLSAPVCLMILARSACFRYANLYSFVSVNTLINPPRR
ncbi:hypothetical protein [Spirosoma oryzicola]|uniref:hypothetical protein n=1 Tax=Spirosoma oryzicola TaxID=2898794 RepID=UPI001E408E2D|nr:hypothetical protein [Spirosoma oryzicola]UHG94945.1 hypothetical protein LQ777_29995 [Spirosoma oryzicola]